MIGLVAAVATALAADVLFAAESGAHVAVWSVPLKGGVPTVLVTDERTHVYPVAVSPDGELFLAERGDEDHLAPSVHRRDGSVVRSWGEKDHGAVFLDDAHVVLFRDVRGAADGTQYVVVRCEIASGAEEELARLPGSVWSDVAPVLSLDGRSVLFHYDRPTRGIYGVNLVSGAIVPIVEHADVVRFSPDGSRVLVTERHATVLASYAAGAMVRPAKPLPDGAIFGEWVDDDRVVVFQLDGPYGAHTVRADVWTVSSGAVEPLAKGLSGKPDVAIERVQCTASDRSFVRVADDAAGLVRKKRHREEEPLVIGLANVSLPLCAP